MSARRLAANALAVLAIVLALAVLVSGAEAGDGHRPGAFRVHVDISTHVSSGGSAVGRVYGDDVQPGA